MISTRQAYGEALLELGTENKDIVVLDADLSGSTMTKKFAEKFPERFFNMGIAEQNMMGYAAGLALSGKTAFASTFAIFASGRGYEIVRNSIGCTKANVKICASHSGITVGEDGASHQCIEDIALMRVIPNMTVVCPADAVSAKKLTKKIVEIDTPVYFRLGRPARPIVYEEENEFEIGKAVKLRDGNDCTVIATGSMVNAAIKASEILKEEGVSLRVIDMHTIKPIDEEAVISAAKETKHIVTAEEHSIIGGLGSAVSQVVVKNHPVPMEFIGIKDSFGQSGKPDELLKAYGLTEEDIVSAVKGVLQDRR